MSQIKKQRLHLHAKAWSFDAEEDDKILKPYIFLERMPGYKKLFDKKKNI